jgi:membrane protein DedA with SNARE-associated domain
MIVFSLLFIVIISCSIAAGFVIRELAIHNGHMMVQASSSSSLSPSSSSSSSQSLLTYQQQQHQENSNSQNSFVSNIINTVRSWIVAYGYAGVFSAMPIETIFPPIPSEVILPLAGYATLNNNGTIFDCILAGMVGALGATVGSILIYLVARKLGRLGIVKFGKYLLLDEKKLVKVEHWFERHASKAIFLARMAPGMREIISIPAGLTKMNFTKYVVFTFAGSLVWSTSLTMIGYTFGKAWQSAVTSYTQVLNYVVVLSILSVIGYFVYRYVKKHRA